MDMHNAVKNVFVYIEARKIPSPYWIFQKSYYILTSVIGLGLPN